jgi:hypothetical protein
MGVGGNLTRLTQVEPTRQADQDKHHTEERQAAEINLR